MAKRVSFSSQNQGISDIQSHYADMKEAAKEYFKPRTGTHVERFLGYSIDDLNTELNKRLEELDNTSSLSILSALEAAFRIDYLRRCYQKKKDPLSRSFQNIYKVREAKASLENDILDSWKLNSTIPNEIFSYLKGAFKYRHWLAHGRYWEPKLGKKYDYQSVYQLAQIIFSSCPFEGVNA